MAGTRYEIADFASLRTAYQTLAEIWRTNGSAVPVSNGVRISSIRKDRYRDLFAASTQHGLMMKHLIQGSGQRSSVAGRREVILSVLAEQRDGQRFFEVAALLVVGRGAVQRTISLTTRKDDWREKLVHFVDWDSIDGIIPAAEGNNQRAMVGLALQLAGIGRGRLEMIEADLPQEVDEAAQLVKGADWLKAGLPRFESAASEALYYLMRIRSVHARMIRSRKQGYYTSMALAALHGSGLTIEQAAEATGMSRGLVEKMTPSASRSAQSIRLEVLGDDFGEIDVQSNPRRATCAARVWRGAAIYTHFLDRRIRIGSQARERIARGDDLVSIGSSLKVERRDLVRILSSRQDDAVAERDRFVKAVIDPVLVRSIAHRRG